MAGQSPTLAPKLPQSPLWSSYPAGAQQTPVSPGAQVCSKPCLYLELGWAMSGEDQWGCRAGPQTNNSHSCPWLPLFLNLTFCGPGGLPALCPCCSFFLERPFPPCVHGDNIRPVASSPR